MFIKLTLICLALTSLVAKECQDCSNRANKEVCGKDGVTYRSFCDLEKQACFQDKDIEFECNGICPCDPLEVVNMDSETVHTLQNARSLFQLQEHEKKELEHSIDYISNTMPKEGDMKNMEAEVLRMANGMRMAQPKPKPQPKTTQPPKQECSTSEMAELPTRLIDWFHVLRINEKVQENKDQRIEQEQVMHAEKFTAEKIRAMYSQLACTEQKDKEIEKAVCLKPVRWMFEHLDGDQDDYLSAIELSEIEGIQSEHCIKPYLQSCDLDKDGRVELSEFCRCLCVTPPCTRLIKDVPAIMRLGVPCPMPGFFVPSCDDDGFFMPQQCNQRKECWCVDRNGGELVGTRKQKESVKCAFYNTANPTRRLVPLDVKKENEGLKKSVPTEV